METIWPANRVSHREYPLVSVDGILRQALEHHQAGCVAEALVGYLRALDVEPDNPSALNLAASRMPPWVT